MKTLARHMGIAALILAGFAVIGTGLVAFTHAMTAERIAENERQALLANLTALVPATQYDNAVTEDVLYLADAAFGTAEPIPVYRAYRAGQPVALFATPVAPDGYSGDIRLLIGIYADGTLAGVRVLAHKETPGLGDAIEAARSDWILQFAGKSLGNPEPAQWAVKKDGGHFDQFTGATITPRAVVNATRRFLEYFATHREQLFAKAEKST